MIKRFKKNDLEYEAWCKENKSGFVFNHFGGNDKQKNMNKIHLSTCSSLRRKSDEGRRTYPYEKICSNSLEELIKLIEKERGESWDYCKKNCCFG